MSGHSNLVAWNNNNHSLLFFTVLLASKLYGFYLGSLKQLQSDGGKPGVMLRASSLIHLAPGLGRFEQLEFLAHLSLSLSLCCFASRVAQGSRGLCPKRRESQVPFMVLAPEATQKSIAFSSSKGSYILGKWNKSSLLTRRASKNIF